VRVLSRLEGKTAVVTGGASGIGKAAAMRMAAEGARVAILDCNGTEAETAVSLIRTAGQAAISIPCDVAADAEVALAMQRVAKEFGSIDVLFNSAGVAVRFPVGEQDEAGWDRVLSINLKGSYLCSRHALPYFSKSGGSIIHTSSVTGIIGVRNRAAYSASKGALVALTRSMALDYASRHIRVNCICPGFVRTPLLSALLADPERTARLTALHPLGRLGEPEDIARAVLFLASDESSWITGHALVIDGGFSAGHAMDV
jgi:NAD(P)-dependent dehydrogenase (short-subunit alcohol dehydrogenase family)